MQLQFRQMIVLSDSPGKQAVLTEKGILKPVTGRIYPFDQIVDAHSYVDKGQKKGNVVITIK